MTGSAVIGRSALATTRLRPQLPSALKRADLPRSGPLVGAGCVTLCTTRGASRFAWPTILLRECYARRMSEVASRDLRNDTAGVLKRVLAGEDVVITVNGKAVARLVPVRPARRRWLPRAELAGRLAQAQADPALREDLARLAGDTTDDLGDIR